MKKQKRINFCLLQAKRATALKWRDTVGPNCSQWVEEMSRSLALEKLTYIVRGKVEDFDKMWTPFLQFMRGMRM